MTGSAADQIRSYWDTDAATYDDAAGHRPRTALELAAWAAAARRLLPPPPCAVLDAGAGTGFLTLLLAGQGYRVTALDISRGMLDRLQAKATAAGMEVDISVGDASAPPAGPFDAVVERHVLWTLPDPSAALSAWREAAPSGRLVLFESEWGQGATFGGRVRATAREQLRRARRGAADHHAEYSEALRSHLPLGKGTDAASLAALVAASPWGPPRVERLLDVEWASRRALPSAVDRLLGVTPRFAIVAG